MYLLTFSERPKSSDAQTALNGPFLFTKKELAVDKVYAYVTQRIIDGCIDYFLSNFDGLGIVAEKIQALNDDEQVVEVKSYLENISDTSIKENITSWYFDYAGDEQVEAYFSIISIDSDAHINENSTALPVSTNLLKEDTVMTAICIYEHVLEEISSVDEPAGSSQAFWNALQENVGAYALRQVAIDLAPNIDAAWAVVHPDLFDDSFDWDFIPKILNEAIMHDSENFLSWDKDKWQSFSLTVFDDNDTKSNA